MAFYTHKATFWCANSYFTAYGCKNERLNLFHGFLLEAIKYRTQTANAG